MANAFLDTSLLDKAITFAVKAHENSERRGKGFPYIVHPMEAVSIVATITPDQELLAAAALHDTVEDTDVTIEDIRREFGDRIASIVEAESDKFIEGVSETDSWKARKQAAIDHLAAAPHDAKIVAMGDKLSNMRAIWRDYKAKGDELWKIFHVKDRASHEWHYRGLADAFCELADTDAYQEFMSLLRDVFGTGERTAQEVDMSEYKESGDGFTAISYDHVSGKTMIKLYYDFIPKQVPERELNAAQTVLDMGIKTPKPLRFVKNGNRYGTEFERITGKQSFARAISNNPEQLEYYARTFAKECKKLHSTPCDTSFFPSVKSVYTRYILESTMFTDSEKIKILSFVSKAPDGKTCIHGDLHIGNIITTGAETYWIDLADFAYGDPMFDLGMFYFLAVLNGDGLIRHLFHISKEQMLQVWSIFICEYFGVGPEKVEEINSQIAPFAAVKMIHLLQMKPDDSLLMPNIRKILLGE